MSLPEVPAGVWRHWKGADYLVLGLGHDADVEGRTVVVYVPLYDVPGPRAGGPHGGRLPRGCLARGAAVRLPRVGLTGAVSAGL